VLVPIVRKAIIRGPLDHFGRTFFMLGPYGCLLRLHSVAVKHR
jgi:hypothetical protein